MFNVQTTNCMLYKSEPGVLNSIIKLGRNHAMKETHTRITGRRNHKAALNEKLPTLRNDSSFAVHFSISVSKTRAMLLFKIKIKLIEMFELKERMPGMRSAESR